MAAAWLSLGANIGDPERQLAQAVGLLRAHPDIVVTATSDVMVFPPWGNVAQPDFHNMAASVETALPPRGLLEACLAVEAELGRTRRERWGPRLIDIDIVAYERLELDTPGLTLPHPRAHERDFVLIPLRQIAPEVARWIVGRREA
jgi:2-amino-4-hydroxy-6-hydroxymethyldihydropteridine diphosphokinase